MSVETSWAYYTRSDDEDEKPTDELPVVRLSADEAPPSFPHPVRKRVVLTRDGAAQAMLDGDKTLTVAYYDPREPLMVIDSETKACHTEPAGTRITPLEHYSAEPAGAYSAMVKARRAGLSAAIGKQFLLVSDEIPQGECTRLARGGF